MELLDSPTFELLNSFRRKLHQQPELSGQEANTAKAIAAFLAPTKPTKVLPHLGGHGLVVQYDSGQPGPHVMFRADTDALPIQENNPDMPHQSQVPGVSHKCGHDGHTAMVAALGMWLAQNPLPKGKVSLLFQPAEETGAGAVALMNTPAFTDLQPDYIFGLHNLPGQPLGQLVYKPNVFAAASVGIKITFKGIISHAAQPEKGVSPALATAEMIQYLDQLPQRQPYNDFVLATVIHAGLGQPAFGSIPGQSQIFATLRAFDNKDLEQMKYLLPNKVQAVANQYDLECSYEWVEHFDTTINHQDALQHVVAAGKQNQMAMLQAQTPFRWSEDFGVYTQKWCGAFFGLGSGEDTPALHQDNYDFPDALIPIGLKVYTAILNSIWQA